MFVGPKLLYFTKDEGAFGGFALELLAADPKLTEMQSAIYQGFKNFVPSINRLLCLRHLKQGDEKKLDKLINEQI